MRLEFLSGNKTPERGVPGSAGRNRLTQKCNRCKWYDNENVEKGVQRSADISSVVSHFSPFATEPKNAATKISVQNASRIRHDFSRIPVYMQRKPMISEPGDRFEQEADRVADAILSPGNSDITDEEIHTSAPVVQRQGSEKTSVAKNRESTIAEDREPHTVPHVVHDVLQEPGLPLDGQTRAFFEPRFGYDFSRVRVHAGEKAADSVRAVNARAYTIGEDIFFANGQFSTGSGAGKQLMAHELAHVVQQSKGSRQGQTIFRKINVHDTGCPLDKLDESKSSRDIGTLSGGNIAYGLTNLSISTPGKLRVSGKMTGNTQGEVWIEKGEVFAVAKVKMYLTNEFKNKPCESDKVFGHEILHWFGGCQVFERMITRLERELDALPGPDTRQPVNGNRGVVENARNDLEARAHSILECFRIRVCRDLAQFNRSLDLYDYPKVFNTCPEPHPRVPAVPPIVNYTSTCGAPSPACTRMFPKP
jgi:hypothetical protein